jgi:hypothetical protein
VLDLSYSPDGTSLSEFTERPLEGLKDLLCWREMFNGTGQEKWNIQDPQLGGASQTPPITSGYTFAHTLEFNSEQRLLLPPGSSRRPYWPNPVSISCVCDGQPEDEELPSSAFVTAVAFRPSHLGFARQTQIEYEVTGPTGTVSPYIKGHLVGIYRGNTANQDTGTGMLYRITKDGSEMLPPTQAPTRQQLFDATEEEGSYLVTVTPTGSYGYPSTALPTNKDFFSFVIDRKKPVVGFTPLDDVFVGDYGSNNLPSITAGLGQTAVMSTKPLFQSMNDESPDGVMTRPLFTQMETFPVVNVLDPNVAGTFSIRPVGAADVRDLAHNAPDQMFSQTWTVHAVDQRANIVEGSPSSHTYFGAIPKLQQPVLETREYCRPRSQAERISSLKLTFDRPVDPETVENSQVRLYCNGVLAAGCTIEQADATTMKWQISVPLGVQQSATFCFLEYDPAGTVMTAETFEELHYPTKKDFPKSSTRLTELFRKVLVSDDDGKRYSLSVSLWPDPFVEIGNGNPLDVNGNPYDPEPSVIVARTSWLMADVDGWPRLIDTSSVLRGFVVGRAASIGASTSIDMTQNNLTITSTGDIGIAAESAPDAISFGGVNTPAVVLPQEFFTDFGLVAKAVNYEGYIPRAPVTGATGPFSYWGLGIPIDPSPPALVPPCAGPTELQWHSSAITCNTDITGFSARIVLLDEYGNNLIPPEDVGGYYMQGKVVFGEPLENFTGLAWSGQPPGDFNHVVSDLFPRIMALENAPIISLGTEFQGYELAQNMWSGVVEGGGTEINAQPMATQTAYFIDGEAVTSSPYWINSNPQFRVVHETVERTFGNSETTLAEAKEGLRFEVNDMEPSGGTPLAKALRSVTDARYSLEGVQAMLSASRQAKTFPALKTTTLGPLVLTLSLRACIKAETTYADNEPQPTQFVYVNEERPRVAFDEWLTEVMEGVTSGLGGDTPTNFYYDEEEETWKMPPVSAVLYCTRGGSIDQRTVTERVLNDYVCTHTLTPDQEVALANGDEITMPLGDVDGVYSVKLKRS